MIRVFDYNIATEEITEKIALAEALTPPEAGHRRWIDISAKVGAEVSLLGKKFGLHPLTIEDCLHFNQRPKLEEFNTPEQNYLFVVIHYFQEQQGHSLKNKNELNKSVNYTVEGQPYTLHLNELHAFIGPNYLVTVHDYASAPLDAVWHRLRNDPEGFKKGCDFIYYQLADQVCDSNFPILERITEAIDGIEEKVIISPERSLLSQIYELRKVLVMMRRVLSPQRDIMALLARQTSKECISAQVAFYFRDVYDHLVRINESIEAGRDLLGNCVDAYLSSVGQRTNEIVKQLTILSSIILPLTLVCGFFGMNFELLPYKSIYALVAVLIGMFVFIPLVMFYWFYRKKWLT